MTEDRLGRSGDSGSKILYCSFCGKSQHEVRKLIAGPSVFICDECVELCNDIIREELEEKSQSARSSLPKPREILSMRQRLNEILAKHTGQALETIARDTERDNFKSAEAAREYGLVDEVLERRPEESIQPS